MDESESKATEEGINDDHALSTWARVYLHGLIACVFFAMLGYAVSKLVPIFDVTGNRAVAVALAVIAILAGPPVIGSLILFGILPLLGRRKGWSGLLGWDDRLLEEVAAAKSNAKVVIVNWPSREVRTMGVMTSTFSAGPSNEQVAAVYIPTAPHTKLGYIRIVPIEDVEVTSWTLKQWQFFHLTFGAANPVTGDATKLG